MLRPPVHDPTDSDLALQRPRPVSDRKRLSETWRNRRSDHSERVTNYSVAELHGTANLRHLLIRRKNSCRQRSGSPRPYPRKIEVHRGRHVPEPMSVKTFQQRGRRPEVSLRQVSVVVEANALRTRTHVRVRPDGSMLGPTPRSTREGNKPPRPRHVNHPAKGLFPALVMLKALTADCHVKEIPGQRSSVSVTDNINTRPRLQIHAHVSARTREQSPDRTIDIIGADLEDATARRDQLVGSRDCFQEHLLLGMTQAIAPLRSVDVPPDARQVRCPDPSLHRR